MKKFQIFFLLFVISLSDINYAFAITPEVFIQSTVNRAATTLGSNLTKDERISKLKEICTLKKEKKVATTSENKTVKNLRNEVKQQKETIATLIDRMSILSDQVNSLRSEVGKFKTDVANDVQYLTNRVDG